MLSQIRIYTINKGEMDAFLRHFKKRRSWQCTSASACRLSALG